MSKVQSLLIAITLVGCVGAPVPPEPAAKDVPQLSKDEVANLGAADGFDFCEIYGWYDDGVCDLFCARADADCEQAPSDDSCEAACTNNIRPLIGGCDDTDFDNCVAECRAIEGDPNQIAKAEACSSATQCMYFPPQACFQERGGCIDMCTAAHDEDSCFDKEDCGRICSQEIYWGIHSDEQRDKMEGCFEEGLCQDSGSLTRCVSLSDVRASEDARDVRCADICGRSQAGCFDARSCEFFCPSEEDAEEKFQAYEECVATEQNFFCYWTVENCVDAKLAQN